MKIPYLRPCLQTILASRRGAALTLESDFNAWGRAPRSQQPNKPRDRKLPPGLPRTIAGFKGQGTVRKWRTTAKLVDFRRTCGARSSDAGEGLPTLPCPAWSPQRFGRRRMALNLTGSHCMANMRALPLSYRPDTEHRPSERRPGAAFMAFSMNAGNMRCKTCVHRPAHEPADQTHH